MPAYNFQKQFVPKIESREKNQTIRDKARTAKVGDIAYLYYAQRTKHCRKIGEGIISAVMPVEIGRWATGESYIMVGMNAPYFVRDLECFAQADGFDNFEAMFAWFCGEAGTTYYGFLIQWHSFKPANNL